MNNANCYKRYTEECKEWMYALDVVHEHNNCRAWDNFSGLTANLNAAEFFNLLFEYKAGLFDWNDNYIYFETPEDALAFVLKFS